MQESKQGIMADGLMTIPEVAEFARVTRQTVYNWLNQKGLQSFKIGRNRRIPRRALLDFLGKHLG